ncbi:MAG TPA: sugar ABC transporter permease [Candidatus Dormibacteraeota bacterium]|nr:sugar ABC transporter permease [Candidatus Dormibacteraeota bacterium]
MAARRARRDAWLGYALVGPSLALFGLVYLYPVAYSAYVSVFEWDLMTPKRYVGLANYRELWSPEFGEVLVNTACYSGGVVVLALGLGLALALLLNDRSRLSAGLQACIFSSYIVSWVAVSLLWVWMLDPQYGLVTYGLRLVGLRPVNWLGSPSVALWTLVLVTVWKTIGYPLVIYLAGLQAIPGDFYEAAALDGATGWKRFRFITWPLLSPTTLFLVVTLTIASFQGFDIVKIMTQGGPITSTMIYVYYIYEQAFQYFRLGRASAAVVIFFGLILLLTLLQWLVFRKRVQYTT